MPEDVIARAIAEQASRSPQELGAIAPGVLVGFGDLGLAALVRFRDLLSVSNSGDQAARSVQLMLVAPAGMPVPEGHGIDYLEVWPDWSADRVRLRHIDEWLSPELARSQPDERGIRQADRLAFFSHYQELRSRLQGARDRAMAGAAETGCADTLARGSAAPRRAGMPGLPPGMAQRGGSGGRHPTESSTIPAACTIYLVAGLGDEPGSGMILDAAHLAGQVLQDIPAGQVVGYLALPAGTGRDESRLAKPDAFAALKELDFLGAGGEMPVRYAAGAPSQVLRSPLFSACYLFDGNRPPVAGRAAEKAPAAEPAPADVIALHVHADFVAGGLAWTNRAVRERHARFARPGREDRAGCQTGYRAIGASRLFVDHGRMVRGYRLALADRLLDRVLAPGADDLAERVARLATPWSPGDLSGGLVKRLATAAGRSLKDEVAGWTGELAGRLEAEGPPRPVADWLEARIAELRARLDSLCEDVVGPNLARAVADFEAELDAELTSIGSEAISGSWFGPAHRFLHATGKRLDALHAQAAGQREREAEVVAGCEDLVRDNVAEVDKAFGHPLARFGSSRRMVTERSLAGLQRGLEELLIAGLRLRLQERVPAFFDQAGAAIARRIEAIGAARQRVAQVAARVGQALDEVCREPARPGELFDPAWIQQDVSGALNRDAADENGFEPGTDARHFATDGSAGGLGGAAPHRSGSNDVIDGMAARMLEQLGVATPLELTGRLGEADFDVRLAGAVRDSGDEAARRVPQRTLADRLLQLAGSEAGQREALKQAIEAAAPRLALEAREGADLPAGDACSLLVGIPGGPANPRGAFASLLDLLLLCLDDLSLRVPVSIADLPGPGDQLIFLRECAGFPLRSLKAIDDLAARYREFVRQPKADPVHIAKDPGAFETIPGIFPPDEKTKKRALEAFAIGVQWGVFEVENGIVLHRQKLPGMTFLDTRIIGTLDRPLRAVKYLIDHPDLVQYAQGRVAAIVEEIQADPPKRRDRLARLERYYLRLLEQCRQIVTGPGSMPLSDPEEGRGGMEDEVIRKLPLWDLAEAILAFNARHGLEAAPAAPAEPAEIEDSAVPAALAAELAIAEPAVAPELTVSEVPPSEFEAPVITVQLPHAAYGAPGSADAPLPHATFGVPGSAGVSPSSPSNATAAVSQVQCTECRSVWPSTAKFCAECATPLKRAGTCPECDSPTPPGGKFCPECAAPLAGLPTARSR